MWKEALELSIASGMSNQMWEKKIFYTAASGSHAGAWSTHVGACVSMAAPLQATLVRAFWRCCVQMEDSFCVRCVQEICTSAGSHAGAWRTHTVECSRIGSSTAGHAIAWLSCAAGCG